MTAEEFGLALARPIRRFNVWRRRRVIEKMFRDFEEMFRDPHGCLDKARVKSATERAIYGNNRAYPDTRNST